jgi:hypothetical protein
MLTVPATLESVDTEYLRLSFCHITAKQSTGQLLNFVVLPRTAEQNESYFYFDREIHHEGLGSNYNTIRGTSSQTITGKNSKKKTGNIPKTVVDKSKQYDLACHH